MVRRASAVMELHIGQSQKAGNLAMLTAVEVAHSVAAMAEHVHLYYVVL